MKKFTLSLLTAALVFGSASAQKAKAPAAARSLQSVESVRAIDLKQPSKARKSHPRKSVRANRPMAKEIAGPSADDKLIDETPAGQLTQCVKTGSAYGYSWFTGLIFQNVYGALTNVVISEDKTHVYIQNPIYFNYLSEENWIVGDLNGDEVTFTFPQLVDIDPVYDDDGNIVSEYRDYAVLMEFVEDDPETGDGWFYPTENQKYKFRLNADGSLTSLESEDVMIGWCAYFGEDEVGEDEEPGWSWGGNGDFVTEIAPLTDKPVEAPADVEFAEWQLLSEISSRPVEIGSKDNKMYVKGFFPNMPDAVAVGEVDGNRVTFESGQYLGPYESGGTTAYFLGGNIETVEEDGETYYTFVRTDNMVFDYDKASNVLQSEQSFCISCDAEKILYYTIGEKPYICIPEAEFTVKQLLTPELVMFYDVDDEYDYDAEMYFGFPTIDADRHILPKDRLFYQVIMDNDVFTFYNDEYELPAGMEEMTDIPFGYNSEETIDFYAAGTEHGFIFHTRGFESLGVRTLYKPAEGETLYSPVLWAPGYEGTFGAVEGITIDKTVSSVAFYDLKGIRLSRPAKGISIMRTVLDDGTVKVSKTVVK